MILTGTTTPPDMGQARAASHSRARPARAGSRAAAPRHEKPQPPAGQHRERAAPVTGKSTARHERRPAPFMEERARPEAGSRDTAPGSMQTRRAVSLPDRRKAGSTHGEAVQGCRPDRRRAATIQGHAAAFMDRGAKAGAIPRGPSARFPRNSARPASHIGKRAETPARRHASQRCRPRR